jgi:hypothetical protein
MHKEREVKQMKEYNTLSTIEHFALGKGKPKDDFIRPMDQVPSKKNARGMFGVVYPGRGLGGAGGEREAKLLNLNIYQSKELLNTRDDENYERRVGLKELIFYMQKDPLLKKSKAYYQTLVKKF